jgi:RNA polymerase sigma-70 factor (ECF subfamily)
MTLALRTMVRPHEQPASFEELFRAHYAELVRLAWRIAGESADDVVQEAFLRLSGQPVLQRPENEAVAWLRRVTINLALNQQRGERRARDRQERAARLDEPGRDGDMTRSVERDEERAAVRAALEQVPPRQREALLLRHAGYSYAEIAAVLDCAVGSIGVLLARGERAFRAVYEVTP